MKSEKRHLKVRILASFKNVKNTIRVSKCHKERPRTIVEDPEENMAQEMAEAGALAGELWDQPPSHQTPGPWAHVEPRSR